VWGAYCAGQLGEIRDYCETDVVNTYLVYLKFQKMRGKLNDDGYQREVALVRNTLSAMSEPHWREYLAAWPA
jgi:predicted PolB exonuclease-like 3'-5' exonuclease